MIPRILTAAAVVLTLAGCNGRLDWVEAADEDRCITEFGFARGTPQFGQCTMALRQERFQALSNASAIWAASRPIYAPVPVAPPPRPITCHQMGAFTQCF